MIHWQFARQHFAPVFIFSVKTTEQQDIKALRSTRQPMVEQRTALANQPRSLLAEYGFTIPVGILSLQQQLPKLVEDASNSLTCTLVLEFFRYRFSDSFGGNPPLYLCGLSAL
ncbi:hypothetical protein [Citrobacter rodentium]|uniref:hypothetical protein n=1 Tax=Citrobacter rodentium TaxID=67825 RepID=UPI001E60EA6D|nr:hypothetical protein [Citrobacter rodentium]